MIRRLSALGLSAVGLLLVPAGAVASTTTSSNWAGYAVQRSGAGFRQITARWRVPRVSCRAGQPGYSAMWVGLGGYSETSAALEQIGTESDCASSGRAVYSSWWEMLPAASRPTGLGVRPGQLIQAEVDVSGRRVTLRLTDLSTHRFFRANLTASAVDISSAEWIIEAPSDCTDNNNCQVLPLADFGSAAFSGAQVTAAGGRSGSIASPWWDVTSIALTPGGRGFSSDGGGSAAAAATPSSLYGQGSAFSVSYQQLSGAARRSTIARGRVRH